MQERKQRKGVKGEGQQEKEQRQHKGKEGKGEGNGKRKVKSGQVCAWMGRHSALKKFSWLAPESGVTVPPQAVASALESY